MKRRLIVPVQGWTVCGLLIGFGVLLLPYLALAQELARGTSAPDKHVVVMVWDGLRPDSVTDENTPTLMALARQGVTFARHHSIYPSSTEVNGAALATGLFPNHNGLLGNVEYRPRINEHRTIATEDFDSVRRGDEVTGGHYLGGLTISELLQERGERTAIAGTKPVALLHDRREADRKTGSATIFSGKTLPVSLLETLVNLLKPFPPKTFPNVAQDKWTTKALIEHLWRDGVSKFSVLWLSDPDYSQHDTAPGSKTALSALKSCDDDLRAMLDALEAKGVRTTTDIFVVSDHGFSTIERIVDITPRLVAADFDAVREFKEEPKRGQILVVSLGGSSSFYVVGHEISVIKRLAEFLQRSDFAGVIFSREKIDGAFPLEQVHLDSAAAPDLLISYRWTEKPNELGVPGTITADIGRTVGHGSHGTLSKFDLHNTLIAAGPDFRAGMTDEFPTSNADLAPTILNILGFDHPPHMDGRILSEAVSGVNVGTTKPETITLKAQRNLDGAKWRQYLHCTKFGGETYFDEGNGGGE